MVTGVLTLVGVWIGGMIGGGFGGRFSASEIEMLFPAPVNYAPPTIAEISA